MKIPVISYSHDQKSVFVFWRLFQNPLPFSFVVFYFPKIGFYSIPEHKAKRDENGER